MVLGEAADTARVVELLDQLLIAVRKGNTPTPEDVAYALSETDPHSSKDLGALWGDVPEALRSDISIKPRTHGQRNFLEAVRTH